MTPFCPALCRPVAQGICMLRHVTHSKRQPGHHLRDETCADCSTGREAVAAARAGGQQTLTPAESPRPRPAARPTRRAVFARITDILAGTGLTWRKLRRSRGWRIVRVEVG